jgi:NAD(P)-dependent dehydrogenase (short-subunit alcohol dehydrogenase family)
MKKTALILGASGKIGRHARAAFGTAGWNVRCFDRKRDDLMQSARGADVIVEGKQFSSNSETPDRVADVTGLVEANRHSLASTGT